MDAAIISRVAQETSIPESSVAATIALLEKGATGPFIVHYRKEATGGLDETKVRAIQERLAYYKEVLAQRALLTKLLSDQGKLTDELRARIESCFSKIELDDLHHQFRAKRKTRAAEAIEKGLQPLAEYFWNQEPDAWSVEEHIDVFVDPSKGISTREQALQGSIDIIAEWIYEDFECRKALRELLWNEGFVVSSVVPAKVGQKTKYSMYYDRREPVTTIPSHRVLAIRRGCKEGILVSSIEVDTTKAVECLLARIVREKDSIFAPILEAAARESYNRILRSLIESQVRTLLKERADREAIRVFQENLANLLLSPPAGPIVVMGIDWGKNGECSVAVIDEQGALLEGTPFRLTAPPQAAEAKTLQTAKSSTHEVTPSGDDRSANDQQLPPMPEDQAAGPESISGIGVENSTGDLPQETLTSEPASELPAATDKSEDTEAEAQLTIQAPDAPGLEMQPAQEDAVDMQNPPGEPTADADAPPADSQGTEPELSLANPVEQARKVLRDLVNKYRVRAIAIGTGVGARELENALRQMLSEEGWNDIMIASVNDAGIAIYSSSRIAREEFPDWNASARCAVSLARRLQDPLTELVKIDPKLIGVGQYQHDVDQKELHRGLLQTVQYCVNRVGVNVNTAGESLLRYVSGLNEKLARRIIAVRKSNGPFRSRALLASAAGLDKSSYEQCAAFLRIPDGENPLDRTAIHPEHYPVVEKMASALNAGVGELIGNKELIGSLNLEDFVNDSVGILTLSDIREELLRPGRDPRKTFKAPRFRPDVKDIADLKPGMTLEGTVTNVTNFGAFVDIGVKQDGLVHLSQMSNRFIRDPREAVKVGDVVQVKVISIEPESKRIGLSMKALLPPARKRRRKQLQRKSNAEPAASPLANAPAEAAADSSTSSSPAATRKSVTAGPRTKSARRHDRPQHSQRKQSRRSPSGEETQRQKESTAKVPEPTLREKIAILQSKFRGIS